MMDVDDEISINIMVLSANVVCTSELQPHMTKHLLSRYKNNQKINVEYKLVITGLHLLDPNVLKTADGIIVTFEGKSKQSFNKAQELMDAVYKICSFNSPRLAIATVQHGEIIPKDLQIQHRQFFGKRRAFYLSLSKTTTWSKQINMHYGSPIDAFLCLSAIRLNEDEYRQYVVAREDCTHESEFQYKTGDVFLMTESPNSENWAAADFLGIPFYFYADANYADIQTPIGRVETITKITIPHTRRSKKGDYTEYIIHCESSCGSQWQVSHRYSTLLDFWHQLKSAYSKLNLPEFPPKAIMSRRRSVIDSRRCEIEKIFNIAISKTLIVNSGIIDQFLDLESHRGEALASRFTVSTGQLMILPELSPKSKNHEEKQQQFVSPPLNHCRCIAIVVHKYSPLNEGELDIDVGEYVEVCCILPDGWSFGWIIVSDEEKSNCGGIFPSQYVNILGKDDVISNTGKRVSEYLQIKRNILMETLEEGDNLTIPSAGDLCGINYTAYLCDGSQIDQSYSHPPATEERPVYITLGNTHRYSQSLLQSNMCATTIGLQKALSSMSLKQRVLLTVFPEDAFGDNGQQSIVPPNAVILYDLQLLDIYPITPAHRKHRGSSIWDDPDKNSSSVSPPNRTPPKPI